MFVSRIPAEVKKEVLAKARAGEKVAALASQYGISIKTIYVAGSEWMEVMMSSPPSSTTSSNERMRS
jgi:hypothetical protein